jgi:hypothetical protein
MHEKPQSRSTPGGGFSKYFLCESYQDITVFSFPQNPDSQSDSCTSVSTAVTNPFLFSLRNLCSPLGHSILNISAQAHRWKWNSTAAQAAWHLYVTLPAPYLLRNCPWPRVRSTVQFVQTNEPLMADDQCPTPLNTCICRCAHKQVLTSPTNLATNLANG